jgi:hypothetical protein
MNISLEQMNALAEKINTLRKEETVASDAKKEITAKLAQAEADMINALQTNELVNYRSPFGLASLVMRVSVRTPKTDVEKKAFYEALKAIGEYDAMISVNSMKLNSWYKDKVEQAKEAGEEFEFPGLTGVEESVYLNFRKS